MRQNAPECVRGGRRGCSAGCSNRGERLAVQQVHDRVERRPWDTSLGEEGGCAQGHLVEASLEHLAQGRILRGYLVEVSPAESFEGCLDRPTQPGRLDLTHGGKAREGPDRAGVREGAAEASATGRFFDA